MLHFWIALFVIMVGILFWKWRRPRNFPPGPWALPIIGNLLQVDYRNPLPDFKQMAKRYGNVYSIFVGGDPLVILNGYQTVKDALVNHAAEFSDRPSDPLFIKATNMKGIITAPYGQPWKEQRRITLMLLKNFGLGKKSMEIKILDGIKNLVKAIKDMEGHPFDPKPLIHACISKIICCILFGEQFYTKKEGFTKMVQMIEENIKMFAGIWGQVYNTIPFVRGLPLPFQKIFKNIDAVQGILRKILDEHKRNVVQEEKTDFVYRYLEEMDKSKDSGTFLDEENLFFLMGDLIAGGTDTTINTTLWAVLLMAAYPDVQATCYKEIKSTLDGKENLHYEDRLRMPYTLAVMNEIQRFANIVPFAVPHATKKEALFCGYTIPKGIKVLVDLTSVLRDESQWKFPNEFNPCNFLNCKGEFEKQDAFLPFSAGPRICLGENFARMEVFLIFTALVKQFEIVWPDFSVAPDLTSVFGITQSPLPFKVSLKERK
ncbi:vitamin D 25-hydroxylase-like [Protopterus annectens]|uniref:vitamin D 25-hydroxylase-like n=1 Tax=Protopterus annectens TaxID=7888 RepID=UPI001CFC28FA|nr:vitamin D 25-hydroxylase-like [Protopterus annectens]